MSLTTLYDFFKLSKGLIYREWFMIISSQGGRGLTDKVIT